MPTTGTVPLQQVIPGQLIASSLWNSEFRNIGNLMDPAGIGTYSSTDSQMQLQANPFPGSVTSHATSLGGELERIRYQLALLTNGATDFWYKPPTKNMNALATVVVPIGGMIEWTVATVPSASWHLANGAAISRTTYAALFALIGVTYGDGDSLTTFNLPDCRDRMSIGAGNLYTPPARGGEATHVLTKAEMPVHNHVATSVVTDPTHNHARSLLASISVDNTGSTRVDTYGGVATDPGSVTALASTGVTVATAIANEGSGDAHNNLPPYIAIYKMIRIL